MVVVIFVNFKPCVLSRESPGDHVMPRVKCTLIGPYMYMYVYFLYKNTAYALCGLRLFKTEGQNI